MEEILETCPHCQGAVLISAAGRTYRLAADIDAYEEQGVPFFIWCDCADPGGKRPLLEDLELLPPSTGEEDDD